MLVVLVGTAVHGAWKGLAWQIASLAALLASGYVALQFSDPLAPYLSSSTPWNKFLAMLLLYLATSLTIWMLFRAVKSAIDRVQMGSFDRQLGGIFGVAKGLLYCTVITFFVVTLWGTGREYVLQSRSGYYLSVGLHRATPILPKEVRDYLGEYIDQLNRGLDPRRPGPGGTGLRI
ncbi:MAG: CvpA family protein [Planctomycetes bacterium]|nr:CvpA family protein [Planctomycetota bacterium]